MTLLRAADNAVHSGRPAQHVVPLGLLRRGDVMYVSSFIEDKYPAWYYNVKADPKVTIDIGTDRFAATARALEGDEYEEFARWALENNPLLADCQAKVSRALPLVVLTPAECG
ncbi:nitroreductase/quinone reductase family protein [Nocardia sp. NPDC023852]|uniref:nitroreductase/quinone reductase family protein n=1 Tax=Nocardia sp. NPDC023852 TaxID=3154697 RepID=UPI003408463B